MTQHALQPLDDLLKGALNMTAQANEQAIAAQKIAREAIELVRERAAQRDELAEALQNLLDAVEGNRVTVGDCNQARAVLAKL